MPVVALAPLPKIQFFDNNGLPLAFGKVYTYQTGTTTPLDTYTDNTGTSTNFNPVVLDASGRANIWIGPQAYTFSVATASGTVLYTIDGISAQNMPIQAAIHFAAQAAPSAGAGDYYLWADSTGLRLKMVNNGATDTVVGQNTTDTLTNKTLTSPTITSPTITGAGTAVLGTVTAGNFNAIEIVDGVRNTTIAQAISRLPSCVVTKQGGSITYTHAGTVILPAGRDYTSSTTTSIDSPYIRIVGDGPAPVKLIYTGTSGAYLDWTDGQFGGPKFVSFSGGLYNVLFDGAGASAGTCGLHSWDIVGLELDRVVFQNFTGAGSSGWWMDAINWFQERDKARFETSNCTIGWKITKQAGAFGNTFGYGEFSLWAQTYAGQTAMSLDAGVLTESKLHIVVNGSAGGTAISVSNGGQLSDDLAMIHFENMAAGGGFVVDGTSKVELLGSLDATGVTNTIATGGVYSFFHLGANAGTPSRNVYLDQGDPATVSANPTSSFFQLQTQYWNGSASASDIWQIQPVLQATGANPPSTLLLAHGGSSGAAKVGVSGGLWIMSTPNGPGVTLLNPAGIADSPNVIFQDQSGYVPIVTYAPVSQKSESGADTNVLTFTPPAVKGTYKLSFVLSLSVANTATLGWTATWKDSNGAAQSPTNLALFQTGVAAPALTFATSSAGNYHGEAIIDVDNSATAIVIKLTFGGTSFAGKASATIERLQ